jgi:branched-chain amino acid transport system ATP-binding protein
LVDTAASRVDGGLLVGADVRKQFGALTVLDGVNFALRANEAVGIVGPNGAGKTTLLNVLAGAYRPSAGAVFFKGANVTRFEAAQRCRLGIARSHQIPRPFGGDDRVRELLRGGDDRCRPGRSARLSMLRRRA